MRRKGGLHFGNNSDVRCRILFPVDHEMRAERLIRRMSSCDLPDMVLRINEFAKNDYVSWAKIEGRVTFIKTSHCGALYICARERRIMQGRPAADDGRTRSGGRGPCRLRCEGGCCGRARRTTDRQSRFNIFGEREREPSLTFFVAEWHTVYQE